MRPAALAFIAAALVAAGCATQPAATRGRPAAVEPLGSPRAPGTSAASLEQVIRESEAALRVRPADSDVAVRLADAWLRQARATGQASQAIKAERVLRTVLLAEPDRADARRLRIAALLAQHRFADALADAERAAAAHPASAWVHAALGDARVQLGHYDLAFAAFDRAAALRPDAASYARIAYGRELTGNLPGALRIMTLAFEAAGPADVEQTAWLLVELGHLHLKLADPRAATRSFARAQHIYPGYEGAVLGAAQAAAATADHLQALALLEPLRPGPAVWRVQLSSLRALRRDEDTARLERDLEAAWRVDAPDPVNLTFLLADQPGRAAEAVELGQRTLRDRDDIFTADALAWAYHQAGRHADARAMSSRALRTATTDPEMLRRARVIAAAARRAEQ